MNLLSSIQDTCRNMLFLVLTPFRLDTLSLRNVTMIQTPSKDLWQIERGFDFPSWRRWMGENWFTSVYISIVYLALIFIGQRWMKNRQPFKLKWIEIGWNFCLGLFFFLGDYRAVPEIWRIFNLPDGLHRVFCICDQHETQTAFWGLLNVLARVVELGGTAFIILKKKPLIFLHYYHHVGVLIYTWYFYQAYEVTLRIFGAVNAAVHVLVYFYFVLKGLGIKMPRKLSMLLTIVQLGEMFFGIYVNVYNLKMKNAQIKCDREFPGIYAALTLYATFFILFGKLFRDAYLVKRPDKRKKE